MKYFAYGSNMDFDQVKCRCDDGHFKFLGRAVLKGFKLKFNKLCRHGGCANIEHDKNSYVEGTLYEVDNYCLRKLDEAEGYPQHYDRIVIVVEFENKKVKAYTYITNPNYLREGLKTKREYLERVLKPCRQGMLSQGYCKELEKLVNQHVL